MKNLLLIAALSMLSGCVNLYAGITQYSVKPFRDPGTGVLICCEARVVSGKNAGSVIAHVVKQGDNFTVDLTEQQINGSQSITAATGAVTGVATAVSDTAKTIQTLSKDIP